MTRAFRPSWFLVGSKLILRWPQDGPGMPNLAQVGPKLRVILCMLLLSCCIACVKFVLNFWSVFLALAGVGAVRDAFRVSESFQLWNLV